MNIKKIAQAQPAKSDIRNYPGDPVVVPPPASKAPGTSVTPSTPPQPSTPAAPTKPSDFTAKPTKAAVPANSPIVRMQNTLIKIRNEFLQTELFNQHGTSEAANSMVDNGAFITPLLDRNVNKNTNFKKDKSQKGDSKPWTFINRLDSILNIGGKDKKGQPIADGVWGQATNLALTGMADIVETVSHLSEKLELPRGSEISNQEISSLRKLIPSDLAKETPQSLATKAEEIIKILESLEEKIERFGQGITGAYVEHDKSQRGMDAGFGFGTNPSKEEEINKLPGLATSFLSNVLQDISNPNSNPLKLSLKNLTNQETLKSFITDNNVTVDGKNPLEGSDRSLINKFLDHLKSGINSEQITVAPEKATPSIPSEFADPWKK